jgi:hypothetical protein
MSGFDTSRPGIVAMAKQFGSILRGYGPPVPQAGVVGDLYIDNLTSRLFEKRDINGLDDWGHYLFIVPPLYTIGLKWFGAGAPSNDLGVPGDYFIQWAGYDNYGMQPTLWGPKLWTGWPEVGDGPGTKIINDTGILQIGLADEGSKLADTMPKQLIAVGIFDEYIIPFPITADPNDPVAQLGVKSSGNLVVVELNPLYTALDEHSL